jgi:hypothetical protein
MLRIVLRTDSHTQVEVTELKDAVRLKVSDELEFDIRKVGIPRNEQIVEQGPDRIIYQCGSSEFVLT